MSLRDHGKHIDADITEASVKATIKMHGIDDPIDIERYMEKPKELIISGDIDTSFGEALQIAEKGQHVLSRAEILKYIAAESGKRAGELCGPLHAFIYLLFHFLRCGWAYTQNFPFFGADVRNYLFDDTKRWQQFFRDINHACQWMCRTGSGCVRVMVVA